MGARAELRAPGRQARARGLHCHHSHRCGVIIRRHAHQRQATSSAPPKASTSRSRTRTRHSDKAPDALRDAIETYLLADNDARRRGDAAASQKARDRAIALADRLTTQYPKYQYHAQYQALRARLLAESGKREEALTALQKVVAENPSWDGPARRDGADCVHARLAQAETRGGGRVRSVRRGVPSGPAGGRRAVQCGGDVSGGARQRGGIPRVRHVRAIAFRRTRAHHRRSPRGWSIMRARGDSLPESRVSSPRYAPRRRRPSSARRARPASRSRSSERVPPCSRSTRPCASSFRPRRS